MNDTFSAYHPAVNFYYFAVVILFSMFFTHPSLLGISLICAFAYSVYLKGRRALVFNLFGMLPFALLMGLLNPLFNHGGVSILFYLPNDNPVTMEAVLFGAASAVMFVTVIMWFSCYNVIMTSDKFTSLFGKIIPGISLVFTMALRFVPRYKEQLKVIANAQKCIGRNVTDGKWMDKVKNGLHILSIMITWAMENAVDTADSMKARGYGLPGRTKFSHFRIERRDIVTLIVMTGFTIIILVCAFCGAVEMRYFPMIKMAPIGVLGVLANVSYLALCVTPLAINMGEDIRWNYLKSKI